MSRQTTRDTEPERHLRSELHRRGLRYWIHRQVVPGLRREADVVFPRARVAVFVDGCFWHGCPVHRTHPRRNSAFWAEKIEGNRARDADTDAQLTAAGWTVIRVWEHEDPIAAATIIEKSVRSAPPGP